MIREKPKVLLVCSMGLNRSKYLASYLREKGYKTRYGGLGDEKKLLSYLRSRRFSIKNLKLNPSEIIYKKPNNPFKQKDVDWADIIIVVRKKHKPLLKRRYRLGNKKIIVLDVSDSRRRIGKKFPKFRDMGFKEFNNKWTYPQLRKAIKPYLPLNVK